jgi:uncharacterized protein (DUF2336 family)
MNLFQRLFGGLKKKSKKPVPEMSSAAILRSPDIKPRIALAARPDAPPEILFVLSGDPAPEVRRNVAANPSTPGLVAPILARDGDVDVRSALLNRLVRLLPQLTSEQHGELYRLTVTALETLAHDQVRAVREALANTLKDVAFAPNTVVACLAHDVEQTVAAPVLKFCTNLTDEDLLDVIANNPNTWSLAAIAQRAKVSGVVADAIIDSGDVRAGSLLLDNSGAVIREPALEQMVDHAPGVPEWHVSLARRSALPRRLAVRLATFVDKSVMDVLEKRRDFDAETKREIVTVTRRRLNYIESMNAKATPAERAAEMLKKNRLDDTAIADAVSWNDRDFVVAAVGLLAKVPVGIVATILDARNAKAITALAWRANLSMRTGMLLQTRIAHLTGRDMLVARNGEEYPLTEAEMKWQLEFAGAVKAH